MNKVEFEDWNNWLTVIDHQGSRRITDHFRGISGTYIYIPHINTGKTEGCRHVTGWLDWVANTGIDRN
jgi:hypothetical protein